MKTFFTVRLEPQLGSYFPLLAEAAKRIVQSEEVDVHFDFNEKSYRVGFLREGFEKPRQVILEEVGGDRIEI